MHYNSVLVRSTPIRCATVLAKEAGDWQVGFEVTNTFFFYVKVATLTPHHTPPLTVPPTLADRAIFGTVSDREVVFYDNPDSSYYLSLAYFSSFCFSPSTCRSKLWQLQHMPK